MKLQIERRLDKSEDELTKEELKESALTETLPAIITDDAKHDRLLFIVEGLMNKGEDNLSLEEEKLASNDLLYVFILFNGRF